MSCSEFVERARKFLKRNEAFIDFTAKIIIGFASICISISAAKVARLQARISEVSVAPDFRVELGYVVNPKTNKADDLVAKIYNDGFPASDIEMNVKSLLTVSEQSVHGRWAVNVPVIFLIGSHPTGQSRGLLCTFEQPNNNTDLVRLDRRLQDISQSKNGSFYNDKLQNLVTIDYKDAMDIRHTKYYIVGIQGNGLEIEKGQAKMFQNNYSRSEDSLVDVSELSLPNVLNELRAAREK